MTCSSLKLAMAGVVAPNQLPLVTLPHLLQLQHPGTHRAKRRGRQMGRPALGGDAEFASRGLSSSARSAQERRHCASAPALILGIELASDGAGRAINRHCRYAAIVFLCLLFLLLFMQLLLNMVRLALSFVNEAKKTLQSRMRISIAGFSLAVFVHFPS